jgi:hypothetical protein
MQILDGREALTPVFDDLNRRQATMHFNGQSTMLLSGDRATGAHCLLLPWKRGTVPRDGLTKKLRLQYQPLIFFAASCVINPALTTRFAQGLHPSRYCLLLAELT